jgi:hypothetical protein
MVIGFGDMDPSESVPSFAPELKQKLIDVSLFAPAPKHERTDVSDPLDQAGQTVLGMLQQAAVAASENCQQALDVAQKLSLQLRAAEDRIKDLEADVQHYQERAARGEEWLLHIAKDIELKFLDPNAGRSQQSPARQSGPLRRRLEAAE